MARAITTMGMTTAIAILPPEESDPDELEPPPEAPRAEGVEDADEVELWEFVTTAVEVAGDCGEVEVMVTTVGVCVEPPAMGVWVVIDVTTGLDVVVGDKDEAVVGTIVVVDGEI